jgi:hypothetical protein
MDMMRDTVDSVSQNGTTFSTWNAARAKDAHRSLPESRKRCSHPHCYAFAVIHGNVPGPIAAMIVALV